MCVFSFRYIVIITLTITRDNADPRKKLSNNHLINIMNRSGVISKQDSGDIDAVDTLNVESISAAIDSLEVDLSKSYHN